MSEISDKTYIFKRGIKRPIFMFKDMEFFGSITVGERGQVVLPADVRKRFSIKTGDKLLVLGVKRSEDGWIIHLVESSVLTRMFKGMSENISKILEAQKASEKKRTGTGR